MQEVHIARAALPLLPDRNCRWNLYFNCRINDQCSNRRYRSGSKYSWNIYDYLYIYQWHMQQHNNSINNYYSITDCDDRLHRFTILRNRNCYCYQTGTAGGTYTSTAGFTINAATGDINLVTSTPSGTYTITYTFTNGTCSNTTTTTVIINALPTATIDYAGSSILRNRNCDGYQTGTAGGTYTSAPAGLTINAATGDINLVTSTPGTYTSYIHSPMVPAAIQQQHL